MPGVVGSHIGRSKRPWLPPSQRRFRISRYVVIVSVERGVGCAGIFHRHILVLMGNADPHNRYPRIDIVILVQIAGNQANILAVCGFRDFHVACRLQRLFRHHINVRVVIRFFG